ncbi:MAG: ATP-dependent DNA helicase RecG, partial [Acidobacteria bacterium]
MKQEGAAEAPFLATPLQYLKGVGPRRAADFERAGLKTVEDLLYRFPIRYEDRSRLQTIASLKPGQPASISGRILACGLRSTRRPGFKIFEASIDDGSRSIRAVWLNQPFLRDILARGQHLVLYGAVELYGGGGLQLLNPQYEILDDEDAETIHTGRIVPVYEKTGAVTPKMQRRLVFDALQRLPPDLAEQLPEDLRLRLRLPTRVAALHAMHFPPADARLDALNRFATPAQQRLIFEEAFLFQMGLLARRRSAAAERKPIDIRVDDRVRESARRVLPFKLTNGQKQALKEIVDDMRSPHPMNRLLQGDVGAGKTIVALLAALVAMENGLQVAFMAPTEILAEQHFLNISRLLQASHFRVALLTGSTAASARRQQLAEIEAGTIDLVVGTHALVQGDVRFKQLGLAVIDEQHRFGVLQRATLRTKALHPDVLVMTATPIPRTLALTVYGDLDVSMIRELPAGRVPIRTVAKPESRRDEIHEFVRGQLDGGRQVYVVYPLVEESAKVDVKAATEMADTLGSDVFPQYRVGLLHGRMKADGRDRVMKAFAAGDVDILVSTTVVEVGIDVQNASVMLVEHAERFGLSQLHQLRGRVGRDR